MIERLFSMRSQADAESVDVRENSGIQLWQVAFR